MPPEAVQLLARVGVPDPNRHVVAAGKDLPAVRRKGHGVNFAGVSLEPAHQFPVRDAQDVSRFFSRGKDGFPVGGKRHRHPLARQIVEALQFPTGLDVPEAERSPDSSRQDCLPVRGEGGAVDAARLFQAMQLLAAVHVPQERDIISAAREGDPAVVGDGDVPDLLGVSRERADFMAVLQVPEAHHLVVAHGNGPPPVREEGDAMHSARLPAAIQHHVAAGNVPQANGVVIARGDDSYARPAKQRGGGSLPRLRRNAGPRRAAPWGPGSMPSSGLSAGRGLRPIFHRRFVWRSAPARRPPTWPVPYRG